MKIYERFFGNFPINPYIGNENRVNGPISGCRRSNILGTEISWSHDKNVGLRIRESTDKQRHIDVGLFVKNNFSYVNRGFTDQPDKTNKYVESKDPFDASKKKVHLKVLVVKTSIEVFIDDGYVCNLFK
ncbi:GH32 C-terminal domain-containing protein [Neobacillus pocheonensis]|uniref:GH32 C-terminal domain-containing protein n=1 Tax=Neobacillus pocheonensis TaxID=363869 RepID=A0ABT0WDU0_9BACI|nr:GH32 C-terminal domain-containing protein [Neobacillus pocheonensis]